MAAQTEQQPRPARLIDVIGPPSDATLRRVVALLRLAEPTRPLERAEHKASA